MCEPAEGGLGLLTADDSLGLHTAAAVVADSVSTDAQAGSLNFQLLLGGLTDSRAFCCAMAWMPSNITFVRGCRCEHAGVHIQQQTLCEVAAMHHSTQGRLHVVFAPQHPSSRSHPNMLQRGAKATVSPSLGVKKSKSIAVLQPICCCIYAPARLVLCVGCSCL